MTLAVFGTNGIAFRQPLTEGLMTQRALFMSKDKVARVSSRIELLLEVGRPCT